MILNRAELAKLSKRGLHFDGHMKNISDDFTVELPCAMKNTKVGLHVEMGAFSYMVSGYIFATKVGRYCCIGENVQIGRQNHPLHWLSSSSYFYVPGTNVQPLEKEFISLVNTEYYKKSNPREMKFSEIGHDVWIGHGVIVNAGVKVDTGAVIAAGAVVTKNVEPYQIVGGNPAKLIRYRFEENIREELLKTEWWNYSVKELSRFEYHDIQTFIKLFDKSKLKPLALEKLKIEELLK